MKDICILINSCINYSDMWGNIEFLYNKYWNNHPNIFLLTDKDGDTKKQLETITFDGDMSDRLIFALNHIKTKYVFLSFDDYYPKKQVNVQKIESLLELMKSKNLDYCRVFYDPKVSGKPQSNLKFRDLPLEKTYEVNFYPAIWKRTSLIKLLKSNEDIWKTEARLTRRAKENGLKCIYVKENGIFDFVDVVRKGKYLRSAYRHLKRNNLFISDRKKRTIKETLHLNTRIFLSNHLPKGMKEHLKEKGRKKGSIYYSDYAETDD